MAVMQCVLATSLLYLLVNLKFAMSANFTEIQASEMIGNYSKKHHPKKSHFPDGFEIFDENNVSIPVFYAVNGESWTVKCPVKQSLKSDVIWSRDGEIVREHTRVNVDCRIYCVCSSLFVTPKASGSDLSIENMMSDVQGMYTCMSNNDRTWSFYLIVKGKNSCHPNVVFYVCIVAFIVVLILALLFVCCMTWKERDSRHSAQQYLMSGMYLRPQVSSSGTPRLTSYRRTNDEIESPSYPAQMTSYRQTCDEKESPSYPAQNQQEKILPHASPRGERRVSF